MVRQTTHATASCVFGVVGPLNQSYSGGSDGDGGGYSDGDGGGYWMLYCHCHHGGDADGGGGGDGGSEHTRQPELTTLLSEDHWIAPGPKMKLEGPSPSPELKLVNVPDGWLGMRR
jgi:hypothetical protein